MDHRGFVTMFEMHEYMTERWNSRVTDNDDVYVLGDFSMGYGVQSWELFNKLNGKITLIEGNHDTFYLDDPEFDDSRFENINSYMEVIDGGRKVILSHYPQIAYNGQFNVDSNGNYNTFMLYGHVHNTYDEYIINNMINNSNNLLRDTLSGEKLPTPYNLINTFCAFCNYVPATLDEWISIDKKRRELINQKDSQEKLDNEKWNSLNLEMVRKGREGW